MDFNWIFWLSSFFPSQHLHFHMTYSAGLLPKTNKNLASPLKNDQLWFIVQSRAHKHTHMHPPCVFIEVLMVNPVCYFKLCVPLSAIILSSVINCYNLRSININAHVWLPWQWSQCRLAACWQDNRCISTDKWQNQQAEDGRPASMWPPDEPWSGQKLTETQAGIGITHTTDTLQHRSVMELTLTRSPHCSAFGFDYDSRRDIFMAQRVSSPVT